MSDENAVLTEVEDGVLIVTMNRPEAKNAMNKAQAEGISAAMDRLESDSSLSCAILTGAGGTFCSGMDLKGFLRGERPSIEGRGFGGLTEWTPSKPVIAAVDGYALAGGLELAISCDLIVANAGSKFGIPEAKRGLAAAAGGLIKLPRQIPPRIAMELALTGDFIDAPRALALGLVNRVVEGPSIEGAKELARTVAANGPLALIASKAVIRQSHTWSDDEMWTKQGALVGHVFMSEDAREGAAAFAEKRKPNWKGK
ncbi:MAG: crotonase/enoyl-CoA hydratase family protein [Sphingomonadaceae bacterium]